MKLDEALCARTNAAFAAVLRGGKQLTRRHADAVAEAADRFSRFLQMPVTLRGVGG